MARQNNTPLPATLTFFGAVLVFLFLTTGCTSNRAGRTGPPETVPSPVNSLSTGTGWTISSTSPRVSITTGASHSCALLKNGTVWCWGANLQGELGIAAKSYHSLIPLKVSGITTATAISAGSRSTCACLSNGTIQCWGENGFGQLGDGSQTNSTTPVAVSGITNATSVSVASAHSCASLANGTVRCWGTNLGGQLGSGTADFGSSSTPVEVSGISTATAVSSGGVHSCALLKNGTLQCWGDNRAGQLGNGTKSHYSPIPVKVSGIATATAISVGKNSQTCAILSTGTIQCWGMGKLGNGTTAGSATPVEVSGIRTATSVSAGAIHTCARLSNGTVQCWGDGLLGNGTSSSTIPVEVTGITTATAVSSGHSQTCAELSNNTVQCWGLNFSGELGNGTKTMSPTPVQVIGLP